MTPITPSFNLLDEPWIRVTRLNGAPDEVSLLTVFREAADIAGIHGEIASQDVAVLRLLLAICHRTMGGPEEMEVWEEYWNDSGKLGRDAVTYLERYRDRFYLRHPERPFFQMAGIRPSTEKLTSPRCLIADVSNNNIFFTTRLNPNIDKITWKESARWLIHAHAFDVAGNHSGALGDPRVKDNKIFSKHHARWTGWAGHFGTVHVAGNTLHKTLLLNTTVCEEVPDLSAVDLTDDLPPWEHESRKADFRPAPQPSGPAQCYTWQSRTILLHGDDHYVTGVFLSFGDDTDLRNKFTLEPMSAWEYSVSETRKSKTPVYVPRRLPTHQAFWQGLRALIVQLSPRTTVKGVGEVTKYRSPGVVLFYQELMFQGIVPMSGIIPLRAIGINYRTNDAVISELIDDILYLPIRLLNPDNTRLLAVVHDAMEETTGVASALRNLAKNLDKALGGSSDTARAACNRAGAAFYQVIDERFPRWLASLDGADPAEARNQWRTLLRSEAWRQQETLTSAAPAVAFAGRGEGKGRMDVGRALAYFRAALNKAVPPPEPQDAPVENGERTSA